MPNLPSIGQIFIPNKKKSPDYISLYEEKIGTDAPIYLFLVIEIKGNKQSPASKNEEQFDQLTETIARTLKRTYLNETNINVNTFEKALSNINQQLSELARRGLTGWYKKLNALISVYHKNEAYVSVTGSTSAFLLRENQFTNISDGVSSGSKPHPLKTFVNLSSGALAEKDVIIFSTANLYNYISLEKLKRLLSDHSLETVTKEIISSLKKGSGPQDSFGAFIIKMSSRVKLSEAELEPLIAADSHTIIEDVPVKKSRTADMLSYLKTAGQILWKITLGIIAASSWLYRKITKKPGPEKKSEYSYLTKTKSSTKKILFITFVIVAFLLVINVIFANFRRAENDTKKEMEALLEQASLSVTDAEASLIYDDQNGALLSVLEARERIETVLTGPHFEKEAKELSEKINKLNALKIEFWHFII